MLRVHLTIQRRRSIGAVIAFGNEKSRSRNAIVIYICSDTRHIGLLSFCIHSFYAEARAVISEEEEEEEEEEKEGLFQTLLFAG